MFQEMPRDIAYVMNGFPRLSETFITNEIHLLEQLGIRLRLISVKRENESKKHGVVDAIRAPLLYLPAVTSLSGRHLLGWLLDNAGVFVSSHLRIVRRRPLAYFTVLCSALAMCWRYRRTPLEPRKVFLKEFMQAGYIAAYIIDSGTVRHLHGHFCHGVATITWFASQLSGIPFSFTAHAKDIYQADLNPGDLLSRKLSAATFVATCTGANHQHLSARFPHYKRIHTVYHGLDTRYFSPATGRAKDGQPPLLLAVGRLVEKKGFSYLVKACALLKRTSLPFRCLIVGEQGNDSERIARMIEENGLSEQMHIRDAVTQDELRALYRQAAIFALPCQVTEAGDRDGIPNVLAEAMAMAIPVVTTPISGIPELVNDGQNGLLVASQDGKALAMAIETLLRDPELGARLGKAARQTICERFDSRQTTLALRDLFISAVG